MQEIYVWALLAVGLLVFISALDDIAIDILSFFRKRGYSPLIQQVEPSSERPCTTIAVFIANWHEADVLGRMVENNIAAISYRPIVFVLGVYPNDPDTLLVAEELAERHPQLVQVVVNRRNGPTSKGQMLNEMFAKLFRTSEAAPDLVVLHDSEDVIDPRSFDIFVERSAASALVQIPVFSLDSRQRSIVGTTYMEEFAERHSREMVVRSGLRSFVPSAGVGTAIRKDLILHFLGERGHVLQPGSVTEDYLLSAEAHREGFRTEFAFVRSAPAGGSPTVVSTYEYFPKSFRASVRQKARWVYGIAFDGTRRLGWSGTWWDRFFLYRDRKGVLTNLLPALSFVLLFTGVLLGTWEHLLSSPIDVLLAGILVANTLAIAVRLGVKVSALHQIYGIYDIGGLLLRWPLSILINAVATARAWTTFLGESKFASRPIAWAKTQHELPPTFAPVVVLANRNSSRGFATARAVSSGLSVLTVLLLGGYATALLYVDQLAQEEQAMAPFLASLIRMDTGGGATEVTAAADDRSKLGKSAIVADVQHQSPGPQERPTAALGSEFHLERAIDERQLASSLAEKALAAGRVHDRAILDLLELRLKQDGTPDAIVRQELAQATQAAPVAEMAVVQLAAPDAAPSLPIVAKHDGEQSALGSASGLQQAVPGESAAAIVEVPSVGSQERNDVVLGSRVDPQTATEEARLARTLAEKSLAAGRAHDRAVLELVEQRLRQRETPDIAERQEPAQIATPATPLPGKAIGRKKVKARGPDRRKSESLADARPPMRLNWGGR